MQTTLKSCDFSRKVRFATKAAALASKVVVVSHHASFAAVLLNAHVRGSGTLLLMLAVARARLRHAMHQRRVRAMFIGMGGKLQLRALSDSRF